MTIIPQELENIERAIKEAKWRDSTTYPAHMQHAYFLRKDFPTQYNVLKAAIDLHGYDSQFYKQVYRYLEIGVFKYWAYDTLINREHISLTVARKQKRG